MFALIAAIIFFLELLGVKLGHVDMTVLGLLAIAIHLALTTYGPATWWGRGRP
jgi:hypothetical protein